MTYVKVTRLQWYNAMQWLGDAWTGEALNSLDFVVEQTITKAKAWRLERQIQLPL